MKKIFILVISLLYLSMSTGIALNIHYCMNRVASVSLHTGEQDEDACGTCGMDKTDSHCCKDVTKVVKLSDNHQPSKIVFASLSLPADLNISNTDLILPEQGLSAIPHLTYWPPPPRELNQLYLAYSVFRI